MMKILSIFSLLLFSAAAGFSQETRFYQLHHNAKYYESSLVKYSRPSHVLTENNINLPVVAADSAAVKKGSLRVHWISAKGGSWQAKIAMPGWPGTDASGKDSLVILFMTKGAPDTAALPAVCLEDMNDVKFSKVPFSAFNIAPVDKFLTRASIPLKKFRSEREKADITRLKSIVLMQDKCDSTYHTIFIDGISVISNKKNDHTKNVVVIGSSTAAGIGPSCADSTWVNRLRCRLTGLDSSLRIVNLAIGGYTTYRVMPAHFITPAGKPPVSRVNNIDYALHFKPELIIISLPTNDIGSGYGIAEQLKNYDTLLNIASKNKTEVFLTTSQPRNFSDPVKRKLLREMKDTLEYKYKDRVIDFWSAVADSNGTIMKKYDSGDGIHLNDAGHRLLYDSVQKFLVKKKFLNPPL